MITDLTGNQLDANGLPKYSVFLPAISSFYAAFIGNFTDQTRIPPGFVNGTQSVNFLNDQQGLFNYKWALYSAGHTEIDLKKVTLKHQMVTHRDRSSTTMVGDSGGYQIAKGVWPGDWKANSGCPRAAKKREQVLEWLDHYFDYGMILDVPSWVILDKEASDRINIHSVQDALDATRFNNDHFINNRKGKENGGAKFLNVLQGDSHASADAWYHAVKDYCDPTKYPDKHFDGWSFGGQNAVDVHLILRRMVEMIYDGLLEPGLHDWIHVLGTSKLEWAVLFTDIQRAVRANHNPNLTISFDCASPFLAAVNGQVYSAITTPHDGKWSYYMGFCLDDKNLKGDTRPIDQAVIQDKLAKSWISSPVSQLITVGDICHYGPGDLNKIGKEGKTSWDTFSYLLFMAHNVWMHVTAVQTANERYDNGVIPKMLWNSQTTFRNIVNDVFAAPNKKKALEIIDYWSNYWMFIQGGSRGTGGKNVINTLSSFDTLFTT